MGFGSGGNNRLRVITEPMDPYEDKEQEMKHSFGLIHQVV